MNLFKKNIFLILILTTKFCYSQNDTISLNFLIDYRQESYVNTSINLFNSIIDNRIKIRKLNNLPSFAVKITGPSFSRSISEIMQPDGNYKLIEVNNVSSDISLSVSQNIPLTGATININNNLKRFDYLNDKSFTYSSSWLNININQPLNFFNHKKWDNKINNVFDKKNEYEVKQKKNELLQKTVDAYFNFLYNQENEIYTTKRREYLKKLSDTKRNLFEKDYLNELDTIELHIGILENNLALDDILKQKINYMDSYNDLFKEKKINLNSYFIYPEIGYYIPDLSTIKDNFEEYYSNYSEYILLPKEKEINEIKSRRFFTGNISVGYGYNNNTDSFNDIFKSPNNRTNINLNLQIPIFDFNKNKINLEILDYEYSMARNDIKITKNKLIFTIENSFNNLNTIINKLNTLNKLYELKSLQLDKYKILLEKNYIIYSEYEKKDLELYETKMQRVDLIKKYFLNILEIEKLTFINIL